MRSGTTKGAGTGAEFEPDLREKIQACRAAGDHALATQYLRRLRRRVDLKPNEHRQLFRFLARAGRSGLVERYLGMLKRVVPDEKNWDRRCLAFWSEGETDWLFWCASTHPIGVQEAARTLSVLGKVSRKFGEHATASAIESWIGSLDNAGPESGAAAVRPDLRPKPPGRKQASVEVPAAGSADEHVLDLRRSIEALGTRQDDDRRAQLLRRLRRIVALRPSEHRQLFRILKSQNPELVLRYRARMDRAVPDPKSWYNLVLHHWDGDPERLAETLALARPYGLTAELLIGLGRGSVKHGRWAAAEHLLGAAIDIAAGDPGHVLDCAKVWMRSERPERATELLIGMEPSTPGLTTSLLAESIQAEVSQMAETLGPETWLGHAARIDRLESLSPGNPALLRIKSAVAAWQAPQSVRKIAKASSEAPSRRSARAAPDKSSTKRRRSHDFGAWFSDQSSGTADLGALVAVLTELAPRRGRTSEIALFEEYLADALGQAADAGPTPALDDLFLALECALGGRLDLLEAAGRTLRLMGHSDHAAACYVHLPARRLDSAAWLALGREALAAPTTRDTVALSRRIAEKLGSKGVERWARQLAEDGKLAEAEAVLAAIGDPMAALSARLVIIKGLYATGRYQAQLSHTLDLFDVHWPYSDLAPGAAEPIIAAGRLLSRRGSVAQVWANPPESWLEARVGASTPLARWVRATVLAAAMRRPEALAELDAAAEESAECPASGLDFRAEIGALHLQYNDFGAARAAFENAAGRSLADHSGPLKLLTDVLAVCPDARCYPECLVDVIFEELSRDGPIGFDAQPGHLMTVTGTLAHGGSERQTANIIAGMSREPRVRRQTVLIRSIEGDHAFFLPTVSAVDAHIEVYGDNWRDCSALEALVPAVARRPRLAAAIELLPHSHREELLRVLERLLRFCPAAVHIRQDLTVVGLACALAGVPRFVIHRGSLARNTWTHTPLQAEQTLRPMRHLYRRLLTETPCLLANNSGPGIASDQEWLELSDAERFHVIHNAVEFDKLGEAAGPNTAIRAQLGIPETAPVIGGVFRMVAVKRPMLWIETARQVLSRLPDAHFIIAGGEGEFGELVRAYARAHGFVDRLHMPGAVQNVGDWYRAFDVLLLTSEREGLPNVNIEAQHFGVPVVTADVGGAAETILNGVTGLLVAKDAPAEGFAEAVVSVLTRPSAEQAGAAASFVHGAFSSSRAVELLLRAFKL